MEKDKTALNQLIEWIDLSENRITEDPMVQRVQRMCLDDLKQKATELLEKEKEQMEKIWITNQYNSEFESFEQYYSQTYTE